ncbi:MAG: nickel-dependent lactate racemase [Candidatus Helarchaeota archaeon]
MIITTNESVVVNAITKIELPYGSRVIRVKFPPNWKLLGTYAPHDIKATATPGELLSRALDNLIGTPSLKSLLQGKKTAVIISDDKSRPTPSRLLIPPLLDRLNAAGIPDHNIKVIIGRGLHPSLSSQELLEKLGAEVINRIEVQDHNPTDHLTYIGETSFGTRVYINSEVVKADVKIGLGSLLPHELAGYTGGSGIVIPGIAGQTTINENHCLIGSFDAEFGKMAGNTIREDMEEAAQLLGLDLIVNTLLNSKNEILQIFAGAPITAHHAGVTASREIYGVQIPKLADVVLVSSYPRDATFGKALKALFAASLAVKEEGTIILVAPCHEGISSSPIFKEMLLQNPSSDLLFEAIEKGQLPGESCVLYLFSKIKKHRIIIVTTGISSSDITKMGLEYAPSLEHAFHQISQSTPDVLILPKGALTLPYL